MEIKSDGGMALQHSSALKSTTDGSSASITYAERTNLSAVVNSKNQGVNYHTRIQEYKHLLSSDAQRIGQLGADFDELDRQVASQVEKFF